jgi:hypothetical protein
LPGLTRQSIFFERLSVKIEDTRVEPAYDGRKAALILHRCNAASAFPNMTVGVSMQMH